MTVWVWVSCPMFTTLVEVNSDKVIVTTAPIVHKFNGQSIDALLGWLRRKGGLRWVKLK